MRNFFCVALLYIAVSSTTSFAQQSCADLKQCTLLHIVDLDDKVSSAPIVAEALSSSMCRKETDACIDEIHKSALQDAIAKAKADGVLEKFPRIAKDLEEDSNTQARRKETRNFIITNMLTPEVLKSRAKEINVAPKEDSGSWFK